VKKEYLKPVMVFILVLVTTFSVFIIINNNFDSITSGKVFSPSYENKIYSLVGYRKDQNTEKYYFDIVVEDVDQSLALIYGFIPDIVTVNGHVIVDPENFNPSRFSVAVIDSRWFDRQTNSVTLEFSSPNNPHNQTAYISTLNGASNAVTAYYTVYAFNIGITFLMSLYGISLYCNKRSEKYLLWFSIYTGALTIWSLSSFILDSNWSIIKILVSHSYGWCILLDIVICFKIFKTKLPGRFDKLLSLEGIVIILIFWAVLERLFPVASKDYAYLFFISAGALIYACSKHKKGAYLLLVGETISLGMRLVVLLSPLNTVPVSYLVRFMRYSKLFNIPFAICCLLLINRLFAEKFSESEALTEKLEQSNQLLEIKVQERTKELKDQQKLRNTFMTNVFHDLRTPLFVLKGCIEKVNESPGKINQELPVINERMEFIQHLVEDLFLMAKLEDKKVILETERIPLCKLLDKVIKACLVVSEKKGVSLEYDRYCECTAWGDECRLEQALQNLIVNAIYYTKSGGKVFVELKSVDNMAYITITDTGVGIYPEDLDKIFNRYYRVSGTEKHNSTGLGLSIAQEIIKQHNGSISVNSNPGKGTVFTVQLPVIMI
jgi:signal transduction histidine kinase